MNRLQAELQRLYLTPPTHSKEVEEVASTDSRVRALVLELARPADWRALAPLWQGVQTHEALPAPAIAVSGSDGFQLWFSLSQPVPIAQARVFLEGLGQRYLGPMAQDRLRIWPAAHPAHAPQHTPKVPAQQGSADRWSAFIAPDLPPVFCDEPWLDICPNPDAQADILCRLQSTPPADFQRVLASLTSPPAPQDPGVPRPAKDMDPAQFLREVMGDPTVELHLRITAAQALLPYSQT